MDTPCQCGRPATANGRECSTCFRTRLRSVGTTFAPTRTGTDRTAERKLSRRLEHYRKARVEGIQPATTRTRDVDAALAVSDASQTAFRADAEHIAIKEALNV